MGTITSKQRQFAMISSSVHNTEDNVCVIEETKNSNNGELEYARCASSSANSTDSVMEYECSREVRKCVESFD